MTLFPGGLAVKSNGGGGNVGRVEIGGHTDCRFVHGYDARRFREAAKRQGIASPVPES